MSRLERCRICGERLAEPSALAGERTVAEIYRSHRRSHYPWGPNYDVDADPFLARNHRGTDRRPYTVSFHFTAVERVEVEAADEWAAVEVAQAQRTHEGEPRETVHTQVEPAEGEPATR